MEILFQDKFIEKAVKCGHVGETFRISGEFIGEVFGLEMERISNSNGLKD